MADIEEGLRLIRVRQRRMAHVFLAFVPCLILAAGIGRLFSDSEAPVIVVALLYGALFLVYSLRLALTECPRCHGLYHLNWWANPFTRRCLNCGLRLDAAPKPERP
jgi:hypothetical protein